MRQITLLLPPLAALTLAPELAAWLPRGDREADAERGAIAQLQSAFQWPGKSLPVAALLREAAAGDSLGATWVCADPSWVLVEANGARLMASGNLDLDHDEAVELAATLRPSFGDRGMLIETTSPQRWQLRLAAGARLPQFDTPEATLGDSLLEHLPAGDAGRPWRALFNETQVLLHDHPVNRARRARGAREVNALWFWGEGIVPAWVRSKLARVYSDAAVTRALAARAGVKVEPLAAFGNEAVDGDLLIELDAPDAGGWWPRLDAAWGRKDSLLVAFRSGERVRVQRRHRWRFWRRG